VLRRLSFAPGLFQVAVDETHEGDALEVANQLRESPDILWAEPEFLEVIGAKR
jgi:hypothetical protein